MSIHTPWPTHRVQTPPCSKPLMHDEQKILFPRTSLSRYFLQESWQHGRVSDTVPSLHWVCGCVVLQMSVCSLNCCSAALGAHGALSLDQSALLFNRKAPLLLRTGSFRKGSTANSWAPGDTILSLESMWSWLEGSCGKEGSKKAMCPSNIQPIVPQAVPLCQASPLSEWLRAV